MQHILAMPQGFFFFHFTLFIIYFFWLHLIGSLSISDQARAASDDF